MLWTYRVSDLPDKGAEAFLPPPPGVVQRAELSSWGLVHNIGAPGTAVIPSPNPPVTHNVHPSADPRTQTGNCSPEWWRPSIYIAFPDNMGPQAGAAGVAVRHRENVPVPAIDFHRYATPVQRTPPYLGGKVTPNPRVFPRFPSILTGRS